MSIAGRERGSSALAAGIRSRRDGYGRGIYMYPYVRIQLIPAQARKSTVK